MTFVFLVKLKGLLSKYISTTQYLWKGLPEKKMWWKTPSGAAGYICLFFVISVKLVMYLATCTKAIALTKG